MIHALKEWWTVHVTLGPRCYGVLRHRWVNSVESHRNACTRCGLVTIDLEERPAPEGTGR